MIGLLITGKLVNGLLMSRKLVNYSMATNVVLHFVLKEFD